MDGIRMDEGDFEPEQAAPWHAIDQLGARRLQVFDRAPQIRSSESHVVHPGAAAGEEAAHRRVLARRAHQLETTVADEQRRGLDALLDERFTVLQPGVEETLVRRDRLVQIDDREPEVVDSARAHPTDAIGEL